MRFGCLIIAGNLQTVANNMDFGSEGNQTRTTLFQNTWSALTLGSIGIIIAAAVGILALIMGALGGGATRAAIG